MIKRVRSSLAAKICILLSLLLVAASGITYGMIAKFLPSYYSSRLEKELDAESQEIADTIRSYEKIEDAFFAIELFEAGYQVSVVILDEQGEIVWPAQEDTDTAVVEEIKEGDGSGAEFYRYFIQKSGDTSEAVEKEPENEIVSGTAGEDAEQDSVSGTAEEDMEKDSVSEAMKEKSEQDSVSGAAEKEPEQFSVSDEWEAGTDFSGDVSDSWDGTVKMGEFTDGEAAVEMEGDVLYVSNLIKDGGANSAVQHFDLELGDDHYMMIVSGGMQQVNQAMEILYQIFPYILGISAAVAVLFALASSLYLTRPIVRLSRTAGRMAELDFDDRYQGNRTDEIGLLGNSLNELSANLSSALRDLRQANEKLKSDIEKEREAEKKRIEFFSAVSHELKTPITILKGHLTGMLQGVGAYRDQRYYLKRSGETVEKMEGMVQELLTVSRIENHVFEIQKTDIAEQLRQQLADMTELIEEKELELIVNVPDHLVTEVNASMMEKVFRNLLINAVRYTPEGRKNQIRVSLKKAGTDGQRVCCQIENTGVSIPEEALPHLFEAFYRVEQSRNRQTGGSGLGLYIVRMILEQHGAEYRMENTAEGVCFTFLK